MSNNLIIYVYSYNKRKVGVYINLDNTIKRFRKPIQIEFPLYVKGLKLVFWIRPFDIEDGLKTLKINIPQSTLYFQLNKDYGNTVSMDERKSFSFAINNSNIYDVQKCMKEALEWFNDDTIKQIYGRLENGMLVLNPDYKGLVAKYLESHTSIPGGIKMSPTIIEAGNEKYEPAVIIYINKQENYVILRDYEFKRIANFIINFSFVYYDQFALSCIDYCRFTGNVISQEELAKRLEYQRKFNGNTKY